MNVKAVPFKQLIQKYSAKLPVVFEVQDGCYGNVLGGPMDFSSGEIYRVESIDHEVNVTFSDVYSVSSNRGLITLPLNFKGVFSLVTVGQVNATKPLKTLRSIVSNLGLPCTVYPTQDVRTSDFTIPKETEVKIIKNVKFKKTGKMYLYSECLLPNGKRSVLLAIDTAGSFNYDKQYTLEELLQQLPVKVFHITAGAKDQQIPGLPENFTDPLFLSKIDVVNCRPVADTSEVIRIPVDTDFTVKEIKLSEDHFNPSKNIHDLIQSESSFPLCVEVVDFDDALKINGGMRDLQLEQLLIVEASDEIEKVLIGGKERYLSIPKEMYEGRFKRVPRIFQTADDLWQDRYTKKVRVTEDYIVSSSQLDSIFVGDILTATDCKVVSLQDGECEVLICSRESTLPGQPRVLRVPSYAVGNFEEVEFPLDTFTLSHMPCELPFRARLQATPQQRKHNKDDATLRDEAPLTFKLCFNEINILVSVFDESKNTTTHQFIIPEHVSVKVKRRRMPLGYRIPRGSPSYENRLMIDLLSETEYNLLYTNNQAYVEPTAKAPPIPPRSGAKPKQHRACKSQGSWSDSDDDDDYDKPNEIIEAKKSATLNCTGTYVIPDRKHTVKLPLLSKKNMTLNFRKLLPKKLHRSKESTSDLSVYESKYETIESGNTDNDGYLQPKTIKHVDPEVEKLQHRLVDMEVNQEALEKLRELSITQEELVHQLTICSDNDLMIRLKFKKLEIAGLRSLMT